MMSNEFVEQRAFPIVIGSAVSAVVPVLSCDQLCSPSPLNAFQIHIQGETLEIPYRVYYREEQVLKCANNSTVEGLVALCLGSRHHNGNFRQKCIASLLAHETEWTVPFIVQLLGEYVMEIAQVIEKALPAIDSDLYRSFLNENFRYFERVERRAISYWHVYYRQQYPKMKDYPALQALAKLRRIKGR